MRSHSRIAVVALVAMAVFLFSEPRARAESNFTVLWYNLYGGSAAGAASAPFLVADVAFTAQGRWLPLGWAIPQIAIGGGVNAAVAVLGASTYYSSTCAPNPLFDYPNSCGGILPLTIGTAILSVGFIAHGVASLVLYEPPPATKAAGRTGLKSPSAYLRWVPDIMVTRDGNAMVALSGVF